MGCDIHMHTEIKLNGKWEHYSHPRIQRWYALFGKIAGVRSDEQDPVCEPKGLPEDMSIVTALCAKKWEGDAHSATWLDHAEICRLMMWVAATSADAWKFEHNELGYLFGNGWDSWKKYPDSYPEEIEDIRFVCWFDN